MEDVKATAASILKTLGPGGPVGDSDAPEEETSHSGEDVGLQAAGEDVMAAFKSGNIDALVDGLRSLFTLMRDE